MRRLCRALGRVGVLTVALAMAFGCTRRDGFEMPKVTEEGLAARAREDYRHACARCHGVDGRGSDTPPDRAAAPDLTRLAERLGPQFSTEYVAEVITGERDVSAHGQRDMPVWGQQFGRVESGAEAAAALWGQRRLDALASYVVSLQVRPAPGVSR